ncbi:MAG: transglycosylase SLT domain-containing protein [Rhodanobacter sp.]|jgi:membrane-bound lytic murein transglycosylase D
MNGALRQLLLPLALSAALAACTTQPTRAPAPVAVAAPVPAPEPATAASVAEAAPAPVADPWDQLRASFSMPGCDADPSVLAWAARYTRNPDVFESSLRRALPRLTYVQQVAEQYDVPGEFVLLPWVESRYRPARGRRHDAAGMWQIMPVTARAMGLRVDRHYDGRLDIPAATHAVMKLLRQYHDHFHDWRVADYAYNAGEFKVRRLIRHHGTPADKPAIPDLPVRQVTREHLTQLLAIACVIRDPARFQVSLPRLPEAEHLAQAAVTRSITVAHAARLAGMSEAALRQLNPAFRGDRLDARTVPYLVLPADHAREFENAMRSDTTSTAMADRGGSKPGGGRGTHVVSQGESLWQIAREYSTSVTRLQQLNDLSQGQAIQPGQVLKLDDID